MHVATHFFLKCVILQAFFLLGIFGHEARTTTVGVTHRQQQKHDEPPSSSSSYHHQQNRDHQEREKREAANVAARSHAPPAEQRQPQLNSNDILTSPARLLEDMIVPTFTLSELQHGTTRDRDLLDVLTTTGLLVIRVPAASIITKTDNTAALTDASATDNRIMEATEPDDTLRRSRFFGELCRCSDKIGSQIHGGGKILLSDGVTTRSTIATATNGSRHPLPLPKEDIHNICGPETLSSLERAREYVSRAASGAFIPALDRLIQNASASSTATGTAQYSSSTILLSTQATSSEHQRDYYSVSSIVDDSVNLEHFHVYSKKTKEQETASSIDAVIDHALDWHTDGGLFLAFLPAESCNHDVGTTRSIIAQDDSFRIKKFHDPNHSESSFTEVRAVFPAQEQQDGEVIVAIMLGEGAEKWLNTPDSLKLRATRHAVKMKSGERRAWYGMMHLVPANAIIKKSSGTTFSQMRKTSKGHVFVQDADYVTTSSMFDTYQGMPSNQRNLVAHVGGPDDCNNLDSFYCWMICQEVPDSGFSFQENVDSGKSLYCLDPETLHSTNDLGQAVAACSNSTTGVVGSIMKKTCINYWHDTDENVQTYTSLYTGDLTGGDDDSAADNGNANDIGSSEVQKIKYCYGKTDMYMKGFEWESTTCLVYIFQNWVISTRLALVGACLGTIALGILVEAIIRHRRHLLSTWRNGKKKMFWSASLYGAQLISSYIVMLVVMTYSGPLFISVIVGLVIGHVANNWSEITDERSSRRVGIEGSTPCCANFLDNASGDKKENKSSGENQSKDTSQEDGNDCCHCL